MIRDHVEGSHMTSGLRFARVAKLRGILLQHLDIWPETEIASIAFVRAKVAIGWRKAIECVEGFFQHIRRVDFRDFLVFEPFGHALTLAGKAKVRSKVAKLIGERFQEIRCPKRCA